MELLDIHSHHFSGNSSQAILNVRFLKEDFSPKAGQFYSIGVHPWEVELEERIDWKRFEELAGHPQVLAVGECGLDKYVHKELFPAQERIFSRQLEIAERLQKPVLIHNVKSTAAIDSMKERYSHAVPWIQHGFRGKPELALQMVRSGFYLSFGSCFNEESLRKTPLDRLFLETDDSKADIREIYERAACTLGISVEELTEHVQYTIKKVFFNR